MNKYGSNYEINYSAGLEFAKNGGLNLEQNNYPLSIQKPLSIINEPDMVYDIYDNYLSISSSNRDTTNYPLHYDYRINLDTPYTNVKKIELISAIFPNKGSTGSSGDILNESHLIIDIDEINFIEFPNNIGSSPLKGFSILPLKAPTKTTGGFINPELGCIYHKSKIFKTPLSRLGHITIKIRDYKGDLYDFGEPSGSTSKDYQNHFVFKITTEEVSRKILNNRNVY